MEQPTSKPVAWNDEIIFVYMAKLAGAEVTKRKKTVKMYYIFALQMF